MANSRIKGITIELDGNTTKLTQALSKVDKEISKTKTSLKDVDKLLKMDPGNTDLLAQKQKYLQDSISATKDKLDQERAAFEQLKQAPGTEENIEAQERLQREIAETESSLKSLEGEYRNFGSVGAQQVANVGKSMQDVGGKMTDVGRGMTAKVTAPIVAGFAAAVKTTMDFDAEMSKVKAISGATEEEFTALRDKAIEMGDKTKFSASESAEALEYMAMAGWKTSDMLSGIDGIMALAAASEEELGTTSDIVTDTLTAFGLAASDAAHFSDVLAAASSNSNTNVSMLGASFKYAAAPAGALGYSIEDVALALGLMANSGIKADMAGTSLRNMFTRMAKPTTESAMAMDQLGVSLADDFDRMYSFREIMEQLRKSFTNINMSAEEYDAKLDELDAALEEGSLTQKKYDKQLEELNKQAFGAAGAEKARAAAMLGGTRAMSGLLAIANTSEADFDKLANAIDHSSEAMVKTVDGSIVPMNEALSEGVEIVEEYNGAADQMSKTMLDNASGDWTKLSSQLGTLAIQIGDILMPSIRDFIGHLQQLVSWLNGLDPATQQAIVNVALAAAAIGPLLIVLGQVTRSVGSILTIAPKAVGAISSLSGAFTGTAGSAGALGGAMAALPIAGVVAEIGLLTAALITAYQTNDEFRATVDECWASIKQNFEEMKASFDEMGEGITSVLNSMGFEFQNFSEVASAAWEAFSGMIANNQIAPILQEISAAVDAFSSECQLVFGTLGALLKGEWSEAWDIFKEAVSGILEWLVSYVASKIPIVGGYIQQLVGYLKQAKDAEATASSASSGGGGRGTRNFASAMNGGTILRDATIFGAQNGKYLQAGEAGPEVVVGANSLSSMIRSSVPQTDMAQLQTVINNAVGSALQSYGIQLDVTADQDGIFRSIKQMNSQYKKMHGGVGALS